MGALARMTEYSLDVMLKSTRPIRRELIFRKRAPR